MVDAISTVYWLVPPPAPYVILMNDGFNFAISAAAASTESYLSCLLYTSPGRVRDKLRLKA